MAVQAVDGPSTSGEQIDPDLKTTVYTLALQDGNQTAYNMVLEAFLYVSVPCSLPCAPKPDGRNCGRLVSASLAGLLCSGQAMPWLPTT